MITFYQNSSYKDDLNQFCSDCKGLQKTPLYSKKFTDKNIAAMKVAYNPTVKALLVANFDHLAETFTKRNQSVLKSDFLQVNAKNIVSLAKSFLEDQKNEIVFSIKTAFSVKWPDFKIGKWISKEIDTVCEEIDVTKSDIGFKDLDIIIKKFWQNCSEKFIKENNLEKYIPDEELEERMRKLAQNKYVDCSVFATCYLKIEHLLKDFSNKENITNEYRLVTKPLKNDLIFYCDSNNEPVHTGIFLDSKRVISKLGRFAIFKQNPEDSHYGNSYVIARKISETVFPEHDQVSKDQNKNHELEQEPPVQEDNNRCKCILL